MAKFLITGATGFVGKALCALLVSQGQSVRMVSRRPVELYGDIEVVLMGDLACDTDWMQALQRVDFVVHLAARVHVMHDDALDSLSEFRRTNTASTEHLARCAVSAGVKRLVYVSSIKVSGEETRGTHRYTEQDIPQPKDPYGISKWEAEQSLQRVAEETGLEVVIVRPPLVYGAGVKGNFAQMMKVLACGIPLPLASLRNKRDLLYVENLADVLIACATHPAAAGQVYLVSDGEAISTTELLRELGADMGRPARLFSCPPQLLEMAGAMVGKSAQVQRLLGSLQIDSGKIRRELNWKPPYTLQQGLQETAEWYRDKHL